MMTSWMNWMVELVIRCKYFNKKVTCDKNHSYTNLISILFEEDYVKTLYDTHCKIVHKHQFVHMNEFHHFHFVEIHGTNHENKRVCWFVSWLVSWLSVTATALKDKGTNHRK